MIDRTFDVTVSGAGPTGLLSALALARSGLRVAVCGLIPTVGGRTHDERTAALFDTSIRLLGALDVWDDLVGSSAPICAIRLVDSMSRLARAPEVRFEADDVDLDALCWNVPTAAIVQVLHDAVSKDGSCEMLLGRKIISIEPGSDAIDVVLEDGTRVRSLLVVGADGRRSVSRECAGISAKSWDYDQVAIATSFPHSRPHHGVSSEFHRPGGPLTVVPLPGRRSSLVWVERTKQAAEVAKIDDRAFIAALEEQLQGLLGRVRGVAKRSSFPLRGMVAERFAANRVALVGEAAHAFSPIGAQGLNLGIRDVATLVECIVSYGARGGSDIGGNALLHSYSRLRQRDVSLRIYGVNILNRSLTSSLFPVGLGRGALLHAINALPLLKTLLVQAGMSWPGALLDQLKAPGGVSAGRH